MKNLDPTWIFLVFKVPDTLSSSWSAFVPPSSPQGPRSFHSKAPTLLELNDLNLWAGLALSLGYLACVCTCGVPYPLQDKDKGGGMESDLLFLAAQPSGLYSWDLRSRLSGKHLAA